MKQKMFFTLFAFCTLITTQAFAAWQVHPTRLDNIINTATRIIVVEVDDGIMVFAASEATIDNGACHNRAGIYLSSANPMAKYYYATALSAKLTDATVNIELTCDVATERWMIKQISIYNP